MASIARSRRAERSASAAWGTSANRSRNCFVPTWWKTSSTLPGRAGRTRLRSARPPQSSAAVTVHLVVGRLGEVVVGRPHSEEERRGRRADHLVDLGCQLPAGGRRGGG